MSRDRLKERSEKNSIDHMTSAAKAALTVGVGAALFYRGGGRKLLSDVTPIAKKFLTEASSDIKKRAYGRTGSPINIKETYDNLVAAPNSLLNKIKTEQKRIDKPIDFRQDDRSLFGLLNHFTKATKEDSRNLLKQKYNNEIIKQPVMNNFLNNITEPDELLQRDVNRFINDVLPAISRTSDYQHDHVRIMEIMQKHKINNKLDEDQISNIIEDLAAKVRAPSIPFEQYQDEHKNVVKEIQNKILNIDSLEKRYGSKLKTRLKEVALGDEAVTVGDILDNRDKFLGDNNRLFYKQKDNISFKDAVSVLEEMESLLKAKSSENADRFRNLFFDENILRKDASGEMYSLKASGEVLDNFKERFSKTLPGKILKLGEPTLEPSAVVNIGANTFDPQLAALANKTSGIANLADSQMIRILDKTYRVGKDNLEHIEALDDMKLISGERGFKSRAMAQLFREEDFRPRQGFLSQLLDIGQSGKPNFFDNLASSQAKKDNQFWKGNVLDFFLNKEEEQQRLLSTVDTGETITLAKKIKELNNFYRSNTHKIDIHSAKMIEEILPKSESKELFKLLQIEDNDTLLEKLLMRDGSSIRNLSDLLNEDLYSILDKFVKDPDKARKVISVKSSKDMFDFFDVPFISSLEKGKESAGFFDVLRMELSKEALLEFGVESGANKGGLSGPYSFDYEGLTDLIKGANIKSTDKAQIKRLADWAVFQSDNNTFSRFTKNKTIDDLDYINKEVLSNFLTDDATPKSHFYQDLKDNLSKMASEKINYKEPSYQDFLEATDIIKGAEAPQWIHVKKGISVKDIIESENKATMLKAFGKQFTAGAHDPEHLTTSTLNAHFMLARMSDALSFSGLGFSYQSMKSPADLAKNILLKRALPIAAGITYFDYLSDAAEVVTGTSITGAAANALAYTDLGARRITDATGVSNFLKDEKEINPFLSYYFGKEYMTYEERLEWYRSGYSPMRKSRWWQFGSANEWRGSEIAYFQPNYLRRAHSNYKDASLYDNKWEKWSRSIFPTPTNPISPLIYLADPYWLEEKHKEDRPYPMTGKLFPEETPWGVLLNPTLGELIKPQRQMHEDRLSGTTIDVKALIEQRNRDIHRRAINREENNLIRFKEGVIEPVHYTTLSAPTGEERIRSLNISRGRISGTSSGAYRQHTGVTHAGDYLDGPIGFEEYGSTGYGTEGISSFGGANIITPLSDSTKLELEALTGGIIPKAKLAVHERATAFDQIEAINSSIISRAQLGRPKEKGVVTPESIYKTQARYSLDVLQNREALADLKGLSGHDDLTGELAYVAKYIGGIYGYGTARMFPGQPRMKLEDASAMTSPVRAFWDANIGGLGGGQLEIFRRFIPFQNRRAERINPLMNTMPDWLPDRLRTGDPFTSLPKAEMRLPGRGYETLNQLHPDIYGDYGPFDRMKILADVAPYSQEYKVWRDIASQTVQDPYLKEEMKNIRERVIEQSKKYDFHEQKFVGKKLEQRSAIIDEVIDNNTFKILNDNRTYKMAGISVGAGEEGEPVLGSHITPGARVQIAVDNNEYRATNETDGTINAALYVDGQNLNRMLLKSGQAEIRKNDRSAAGQKAMYSDGQAFRGAIFETLAHAPIPYFQQKYFKIRSPIDSYKHEQVYGTPYASWSQPFKSFLQPAYERSLMSGKELSIGLGAYAINKAIHAADLGGKAKTAGNVGLMLTNRGAFMGGFIGMAIDGGMSGGLAKKGAEIGTAVQLAGYAISRRNDPIGGTLSFGLIGGMIGNVLGGEKYALAGAGIGALAGLASSGAGSSIISKDGLRAPWTPKRTKKKWETQEYFDRLNYIKYSGLYEKAARKAFLFEGTNIKKLVNQYEIDRENKDEMRKELLEYKDITRQAYAEGDTRRERIEGEIDNKLKAIEDNEMMMNVGKWGRAALIYKQGRDSTIYGLNKDASWAQLLRALPRPERDYFLEFAKETDPKKRKEILKTVSPLQKKALQIAWGEKVDKQESMLSYFKDKKLPGPIWSGWRPNVDLTNVEIKTIHNEGMLLSDFGHYESQLREQEVINAPNLRPQEASNAAFMSANLVTSLQGMGLTGVNVNVERSSSPGLNIIADIARMGSYNVQQGVRNIFKFA